jgi:ferredoxin
MRIRVDREKCIGAAACVALLPKVFKLDQENKAVIHRQDGQESSDWADYIEVDASPDELIAAAESCPVLAIIIEDDDGNQIYP